MNSDATRHPQTLARATGALYLLAGPLHAFTMVVHWTIFVAGDARATAANVVEHEGTLRLGIMSWLIGQALFIVLPLALYALLKRVHRPAATLMVFFIVASVPIAYVNELNRVAALVLMSGDSAMRAFTADQLDAQVMVFLQMHMHGMMVAHVFWGLWLFPLAFLIVRSGFLPKLLGYLLVVGGVGYLVDCTLFFLRPDLGVTVSQYTFIGEVVLPLWLVFRGVDVERWRQAPGPPWAD